jgi:DNA-directed RNA polymerase subunit omega
MARITVEDCLTKENNRFALVQLASKRTKQLLSGARTLSTEAKGNKVVVTALREIAEGQVRFMNEEDYEVLRKKEEAAALLRAQNQVEAASVADDLFVLPSELNGGSSSEDDEDDEGDDSDDGEISPKKKAALSED